MLFRSGLVDGASEDTELAGDVDVDEGSDDVLEVVEEPMERVSAVPDLGAVRLARWFVDSETSPLSEDRVAAQVLALDAHRTLVGQAGELLGVRPGPRPFTVPDRPVPPDERLLAALDARDQAPSEDEGEDMTERIQIDPLVIGQPFEVEGLPFDPVFSPVRGALRAIAKSPEGIAPTQEAVEAGGDLGWALARARALALLVRGDLSGAQAAVEGMTELEQPEARWAEDRALRFSGRAPEPVDPREARPVAAALAADLTQQLARTLAGTVMRAS